MEMQVLLEKGVEESRILFLSLIAAPAGIRLICGKYPRLKVVTSEIDEGLHPKTAEVVPGMRPPFCSLTKVDLQACFHSPANSQQATW